MLYNRYIQRMDQYVIHELDSTGHEQTVFDIPEDGSDSQTHPSSWGLAN